MQYNLLKLTQLILSSMDSDEVNSIGDTIESQQIVDIIETTFNDIVSAVDFPSDWDLFQLENFGDATRPTILVIPSNINRIEWVQYDVSATGATARDFVTIKPESRYSFFERMNGLDTAESNVYKFNYAVGAQSFDVRGYKDAWPSSYTTVDNNKLIFDNFKLTEQNTLTGGRTKCYGSIVPTFTRTDAFVPPFDNKHFTILLNEAKSQAWIELKQTQNAKAEQRARRGWVNAERHKSKIETQPHLQQVPNYGRRRGRGSGLSKPPKRERGW